MKLTKNNLLDLAKAMQDWEIAKQKDKGADLKDERLIRISTKVKYAIVKNWKKLQGDAEALEETVNDQFKLMGGVISSNGMGTWSDPTEMDNLAIKYKNNKAKLVEELNILKKEAKDKQEKFNEWRKQYGEELASDDPYVGIMGIKPNPDDMDLIPESIWTWYDDLMLMTEPDFAAEEDSEPKDEK